MVIENQEIFKKKSFELGMLDNNRDIKKILDNAPVLCKINNIDTVIGFCTNVTVRIGSFYGDIYIDDKFITNDVIENGISVDSQEIVIDTDILNNKHLIKIIEIILHVSYIT